MSSVVDKLTSIWESISNISSQVINGIGEFFTTLFDYLNPFSENFILKDIILFFGELLSYINPFSENFIMKIFFDWLVDFIKLIFVPDADWLKSQFNEMLESISSSFGISFDSLEEFTNSWTDKPTDSIEENYNIYGLGTLKLKFFDTTYLIQGVERFRPVIRGFVVLLLLLYNYYQVLTFIGQDPRIQAHAEKNYENHLKRKESKKA